MQYTERYELRRTRKGEEPTTEVIDGTAGEAEALWESLSRSMRPGEHIEIVRVSEVIIASGSRA